MKIALNFSALKKGGGQNVALNFLLSFVGRSYKDDYFFMAAKDTKIEKFLSARFPKDRILLLSPNPILRMLEEMTCARSFLKRNHVDVIYSYFGFGLFTKSIPQIMGSADSNLFFPEINFWSQYSGLKLVGKKLIDAYRVYGLKRCEGIVFETELLEKKCHELYKVKALTRTIRPSINIVKGNDVYILNGVKDCKKALLLCGWQLNKNIMLVPYIAKELKSKNIPFQFIITAPLDGSAIQRQFSELASELGVESYIDIIGSVDKKYLKSLYSQIDVILLLSKLESFSNNIIEAWTYRRLLMVADEPWARDICKSGAYYVDRDDAGLIASSLHEITSNEVRYNKIITMGLQELKEYPDIEERTNQELNFIREVYEREI